MKLLIMRHGEAQTHAADDAQRRLTDYGREQAQRAGQCLTQQGFVPDQLWVSPYTRAQQTAQEVLQTLVVADGHTVEQQTLEILVPESSTTAVIESIGKSRCNAILIVSHQPLVSALLGALVYGDTAAARHRGPPMAPASMALLQADERLAGCCDLLWLRHAPNFEIN